MSTDLYEALPYPAQAYAWTHPDHLLALARARGVAAAHPTACRVLELGCGPGGNLLPMAAHLPGSTFVGVDAGAAHIATARAEARALGLTNLTLVHGRLEDLDTDGPFDVVVAHGVLSWVPPDVQEALLALAGRVLAPCGVAYLSWDALPGAHGSLALRRLLREHTAGLEPARQVARARRILTVLATTPRAPSSWDAVVRRYAAVRDTLLAHDLLAPHYAPLGVRDVLGRAAAHGLRFLAEALPLDASIGSRADALGATVPEREQWVDWLRGTAHRRTVLCRADVAGGPLRPDGLWLTAHLVHGPDGLRGRSGPVRPREPDDAVLLEHLARERWVPVADLGALRAARWVAEGWAHLRTRPRPWSRDGGEHPRTSACIRRQAPTGEVVSLAHTHVPLSPTDADLLAVLDGRHPRAELPADRLRALAARALLLP